MIVIGVCGTENTKISPILESLIDMGNITTKDRGCTLCKFKRDGKVYKILISTSHYSFDSMVNFIKSLFKQRAKVKVDAIIQATLSYDHSNSADALKRVSKQWFNNTPLFYTMGHLERYYGRFDIHTFKSIDYVIWESEARTILDFTIAAVDLERANSISDSATD